MVLINIDKCYQVTTDVLNECYYNQLELYKVDLKGTVLKPNMVIPSDQNAKINLALKKLLKKPLLFGSQISEVPGIAFLSGLRISEIELVKNLGRA